MLIPLDTQDETFLVAESQVSTTIIVVDSALNTNIFRIGPNLSKTNDSTSRV